MSTMLLVCWMLGARAAEPAVADRSTLVLVRALSYDRQLSRRTGELRVAVVYDPARLRDAEAARAVLDGLVGVTVGGRALGAPTLVSIGGLTPWGERLAGFDVALLCSGIDTELPEIVDAARALDLTTLSLDPAFVGRGAAIGVSVEGSRLVLRVDRVAATEEGADLSGELLEIARLVEGR